MRSRALLALATTVLLVGSNATPVLADPGWSLVPDGKSTTATNYLPGQKALPGSARVVRERWLSPRMLDLLISSPSIGLMTPVRLLLPKGWSKQANRTWPVLYLLHGGAHNYTSSPRTPDIAGVTEKR